MLPWQLVGSSNIDNGLHSCNHNLYLHIHPNLYTLVIEGVNRVLLRIIYTLRIKRDLQPAGSQQLIKLFPAIKAALLSNAFFYVWTCSMCVWMIVRHLWTFRDVFVCPIFSARRYTSLLPRRLQRRMPSSDG